MTLCVVWRNADGSITIDVPGLFSIPNETPDQYLDRVAAQLAKKPELTGATRLPNIDDSALPQSRRFRSAWRDAGGSILPNFPASRARLIAELRATRDRILAQSDALKAKYEDIGSAAQKLAVFNYRQSLRDVTTQIQTDLQAMTTVAQLEAYVAPIPALPAGISL